MVYSQNNWWLKQNKRFTTPKFTEIADDHFFISCTLVSKISNHECFVRMNIIFSLPNGIKKGKDERGAHPYLNYPKPKPMKKLPVC